MVSLLLVLAHSRFGLNMVASSFGAGGVVTMVSTGGAIQFSGGNGIQSFGLDQGGTINLTAHGDILIGAIEANYDNVAGIPGLVNLKSETGAITFSSINTQSQNETGGNVSLSAFGSVVGSGSFLASNGETTTISTIGAGGNGNVFIEHSAGLMPDFEIGQNLTPVNGVFGDLAAGPP